MTVTHRKVIGEGRTLNGRKSENVKESGTLAGNWEVKK
jgi:hypothetical protein